MSKQAMAEVMHEVIDFHRDHGIPMRATPSIPPDDRVRLRARLLVEELGETLAAMFDENKGIGGEDVTLAEAIDRLQWCIDEAPVRVDLVGVADGLADVQYVTIGAALEFGLPFDAVWAEVCRSSATKKGATRRADGKIEKPAHYSPPDVRGVLFDGEPSYPGVIVAEPGALVQLNVNEPSPPLKITSRAQAADLYGPEGAAMWDMHVGKIETARFPSKPPPAVEMIPDFGDAPGPEDFGGSDYP